MRSVENQRTGYSGEEVPEAMSPALERKGLGTVERPKEVGQREQNERKRQNPPAVPSSGQRHTKDETGIAQAEKDADDQVHPPPEAYAQEVDSQASHSEHRPSDERRGGIREREGRVHR